MKGIKTKCSLSLAAFLLIMGCVGCRDANHGQEDIRNLQTEQGNGSHNQPTPTNIVATHSANLTDDDVKEILKQLIPKAADIYGMFNGDGWFKLDKSKTIPGDEDYGLVTGETWKTDIDTSQVKSLSDLKNVIEDVFTKDAAQEEFYNRYLNVKEEVGLPLYKDYEGQLYESTKIGGHGSATKYLMDTAKIISQEGDVIVVSFYTTEYDTPYRMTVTLKKVDGKWLLASGASFNNEVYLKPDCVLKYQGEGIDWSAALEDTVWNLDKGKNIVQSRMVLTYKGTDIRKVGHLTVTYGNEAKTYKGTNQLLGADGKLTFEEYADNIKSPTKDDVVKVMVEWEGKQDSFDMRN